MGQILKNYRNFYPKNCLSSQKYGFGIQDPEKTSPGSRGQKGSGSATLPNTSVPEQDGILGRIQIRILINELRKINYRTAEKKTFSMNLQKLFFKSGSTDLIKSGSGTMHNT